MTGDQLKHIRHKLELGRGDFALLLGYVGNDRNNNLRIRRLEAEDEVPLYMGKLAWLIWEHHERTGELPHWPDMLRIEGEEEPWK